MPKRAPADGPISVSKVVDDRVEIIVEDDGMRHRIVIGKFNAVRLLATLSLILHAPLSKSVQKAIKL